MEKPGCQSRPFGSLIHTRIFARDECAMQSASLSETLSHAFPETLAVLSPENLRQASLEALQILEKMSIHTLSGSFGTSSGCEKFIQSYFNLRILCHYSESSVA